jgi:CheY-like chemotaxis protein
MGGSIQVESEPGKGSSFIVRLPCEETRLAVTASKAAMVRDENLPLAGLNILVAEDNLVNQEVIQDILQSDGAHVVLVGNGRAAVDQVASAGGGAFSIVLMDIQMPEMGGHEATRCILEIAPDLPIIGQTAHAFAEEKQTCLDAGMVAHIAKPLDPDNLVKLILHHARRG